jgi:hypothetical protein
MGIVALALLIGLLAVAFAIRHLARVLETQAHEARQANAEMFRATLHRIDIGLNAAWGALERYVAANKLDDRTFTSTGSAEVAQSQYASAHPVQDEVKSPRWRWTPPEDAVDPRGPKGK